MLPDYQKRIEVRQEHFWFDLFTHTAFIPRKGTRKSACLDFPSLESIVLEPGERKLVGLGCRWEVSRVKPGYTLHAKILPRSGNAHKQGIGCVNSPGIIDQDYEGEWHANLINLGQTAARLECGEYVCQVLFCLTPTVIEFDNLLPVARETRGTGGFGSTK
jgi:dUTP pyrophosphatase